MKKQIIGYITGVVNSYSRTIERLEETGAPTITKNSYIAFRDEFNDLLDFIEDIPEGKDQSILAFNVALENETLRKRILELEESCEQMCDIEKNLNKNIEAYEISNVIWKNIYDEAVKENACLRERLKLSELQILKRIEKIFKGIK